ncbi:hypothetical protein [Lactobacillus amylovorus]|uniref:hypothetical protein n=2 Tax=Lactobacillus amylovorus TaxID=1604 RepID=UPI0023300162|nr:hypothetical protein [Lactobacillus amylovorus]MDB6253024.1 hypothetical protein [Lactobacillus amylovorus]
MNRESKKKISRKKRKELKHFRRERVLGIVLTIPHLFFAFWGGMFAFQHFTFLFQTTHVATTECPLIAAGLLVVVLGIFGAYGALHFVFEKTRFEHFFPGYWNW